MAKMVRKAPAGKTSPGRKADRTGPKAAKWGAKPAAKAAGKPGRGKPERDPLARVPRGSPARGTAKSTAAPRRPAVEKKVPKRPPSPLKQKALRPKAPADVAEAAPRAEAEPKHDPARPLAMSIAQAGLDKKAEDVLVLDVRGLTSYADYFVVMTADNERQASAIADHLDDQMKKQGNQRVGSEGYESGRWILIDYGDVVAHVMSREARGFYDLEGLWADAPRFAVA